MFKTCIFFVISWLFLVAGFAQTKNRKQLEREKAKTVQKIAASKKILAETKEQKQTSIGQLKALNQQINSQSQQIDLMEQDLQLLDLEIQEIGQVKQKLSKDVSRLRAEYAEMLFQASKPSNRLNKLAFLFSASTFNQLLMRFRYLQQYTETRRTQVRQITHLNDILKDKQGNLLVKKTSKQQIIEQKVEKTQSLEELKTEQGQVVQELSLKEKELRAEIEEKQRSVGRLENLISSVIEREIARKNKERERRRKQRPKTTKPTVGKPEPQEEEIEVETSSFGQAKGRLPFPVQGGFISGRFGIHEHEVLKGVLEKNDGVDIQTNRNANVRSVYEGIVRSVVNIQGFHNIVAVQHGNYYTVYTKLKTVSVSVGQHLKAKQNIGTAATIGGVSEINFQVWNGTQAQNPENWLDN